MTGNCCVCRKVVRRASLSDRHNLCRKEYETEAIVWRGGREEEPEKEKESDQENNQIVQVRIHGTERRSRCGEVVFIQADRPGCPAPVGVSALVVSHYH